MKRILPIVLALVAFACSDDDNESIKPVIPEEPAAEIPISTAQSDNLIIEGKITEETADGYTAEGTLFVESAGQKAEEASRKLQAKAQYMLIQQTLRI